ncbi:hypothetical protein SAMN05216276_101710 [Streptosporangium subroseum]|uniref:Uncharacterized protein n=1 Tax=Streptosporangium subroseum TaxID=106412 RepID=A0A239HL60_9ACTN|nr:hypothetical protein SAMN05216276_101710 [Streptosporangium subroseum]
MGCLGRKHREKIGVFAGLADRRIGLCERWLFSGEMRPVGVQAEQDREGDAAPYYSAFRNRAAIGAATLPPAPPFWTNTAKAREPR